MSIVLSGDIYMDGEPYFIKKEYEGHVNHEGLKYEFIIKLGQHYPEPSPDYLEIDFEWFLKTKVIPKEVKSQKMRIIQAFRRKYDL
jgi:hypothetical protein